MRTFPIEKRALNVILFFTTGIALLLQLVTYLLESPPLTNLLAAIFPPIFACLYFIGRKTQVSHSVTGWLFLFFTAAAILLDWLIVGFPNGIALTACLALLIVLPIFTDGNQAKVAITLVVALTLSILVLEFRNLNGNKEPYLFEVSHAFVTDRVSTALIVGLGVSMIISMVMISHRRQQKEISRLNASLREMLDKISQDNEKLKLLNTTKNTFFSIIAHDLRNPIGALATLGQLLQDKKSQLDETRRNRIINSIRESSKSTHGLLEDLLLWARDESGQINPNPVALDLERQVESTFQVFEATAAAKGLSLVNAIPKDTFSLADAEMTGTIFRNLVGNAVKAVQDGGKIIVSANASQSGFIEIDISDDGVGMDEETIEKLFSKNELATANNAPNLVGSGLGLILCKRFVESQSGSITAKSKEGEGTSITFTLPAAPMSGASED